jgi:hypothetical protein
MTSQRLKLTAIKAFLFAALLGFASFSWAQVVGTIAHLSGPLVAKKPNGSIKVLAVKSEVENGDTLVAEKNTYAQIKFVDNGEITLRPNTVFKIEKFSYDAAKPEGDAANFDLVKGGLRSVTGLLGKRNKEKFALKTPSATIGIRGTTFVAQYVPPKPTADDMRINYNQSAMEVGTQGKSPAVTPGTGSINRNPESGATLPGSGTDKGKAPSGSVTAGQLAASLGAGTPPSVSQGSQQSNAVLPPPAGGGLGSVGTGLSGQPSGPTPPLLGSGGPGAGGTGASGPSGGPTPLLLGSGGPGSGGTGGSGQSNGPSPLLLGNGGGGSAGTGQSGQLGGPTPTLPGNGGLGSVGQGQGGTLGAPALSPGLHLQVTDGAIVVTNNGGSQGFQAGQFGFVPSLNQPPVIVPNNPGLQFMPPPAFNIGSGPAASNGSGQGTAVDCVVR